MMIRHTLPGSIAAALMLATTVPAFAADRNTTKNPIQGTWNSKLAGLPMTLTFDDGKFSVKIMKKGLMSGPYRVDTKKSPHHLDLIIMEGEPKVVGKTILCIYELKDGKLRWCSNDPLTGNPRAKAFPKKQGEKRKHLYLIFDRVKKSDKKPVENPVKETRSDIPGSVAAALVLVSASPTFAADKDAAKDDLNGTWTASFNGKSMTLTFTGGKLAARSFNGKMIKGTYTTDPTKTPRHLNITIKEGDPKVVGKSALCIYEVSGKKLKWCANDPAKGNPRPTKFPGAVGGNNGNLYLIFDRVEKPDKNPESTTAKQAVKGTMSDLDQLQGDWKTVSAKRGGKDAPLPIQKSKLNVEKDTFTLSFVDEGGNAQKSSINVKLNPSKSPSQIDFLKSGNIDSHGIYKLEGRKLTICFDRKTKPRPEKFESKPGTRMHLMVFERVK